ncbi:MAG: MurR/RpiR family transcriptional regulator [Alteromonadaceae bacterium]|nr:MurR/RpiR family transcriptional regulator [Alteromonadaceae bacterium]
MIFPPENFEQLRLFIVKVNQGDVDFSIGRKSLRALQIMISEPEIVAVNNIVELATVIQLSPASLTRLAKLLGFNGFNQLQKIFKEKSKKANHFYSDNLKKLLAESSTSISSIINKQHDDMINNLQRSISHINEQSWQKATNLLAQKHRIFIFGYRQSSAIASILRYGLALIRPNVQMLVQADHGVAIALGQLRKGDLLVLLGSAPYSNVTIKIASLAKKQHCQILSITDTKLSPLNDFADVALYIPTVSSFYANSMVENCFFIESLLSLTAIELGGSALNNLQQHEQLLADLAVST